MKKILVLLSALMLLACLCGCSSKPELKVFNWGEYIGEDVIKAFEKEYDCKVRYSIFTSNEEMYTKLQGGTVYDVLIPSDYMISRLISENLLQPLDYSIITNKNLCYKDVMGKEFDPSNTYSLPYLWGNVGIVYDTTVVDAEDVETQGWEVLKNPKYKGVVLMYDSERDSFMVAEKALGYSMNTENEAEIKAAYEWLIDLDEKMDPSYMTDEAIDTLANGGYMGYMYSGDAAYICAENEEIAFWVPEEGTNIWVDSMVIPANADQVELANKFINFVLEYDQAYDTSSFVGYSSSNAEVLKELAATEYEGIDAYMPRTGFAADEVYLNLKDAAREMMSELWVNVLKH